MPTSAAKLVTSCQSNVRNYTDGYILKDWTKFQGDISTLPKVPDHTKFWTVQTCKKSTAKVQLLNLNGDCKEFKEKK